MIGAPAPYEGEHQSWVGKRVNEVALLPRGELQGRGTRAALSPLLVVFDQPFDEAVVVRIQYVLLPAA